jgi:hypothetical protein
MKQLGIFSGLQLTWWQVINSALSPHALRLEVLIARYISVADAAMLAALQRLEICQFMDMLRGQLGFDDDIILEVFWRSLLQSVAALDKELENAVAQHDDRGAVLGPASYIDLAIQFLADGIKPHSA